MRLLLLLNQSVSEGTDGLFPASDARPECGGAGGGMGADSGHSPEERDLHGPGSGRTVRASGQGLEARFPGPLCTVLYPEPDRH